MTIALRPYADEDLPRLQAALAGWTREAGLCGYCHVGDLTHRIYEELHGRSVGELVQVWEEGSAVVGVAINLRFGAAFDVFASPAVRGTDAELAMLESAYDTTLRFMAKAVGGDTWVITDAFSCDQTRSELLARLGFERYRLFDYVTQRGLGGAIPAPELPDGFTIRSATMGDGEQLAAVRNSSFATGWSARTLRDQVMTKPGYDPDRELLVVAPDGRVAAFTISWLDELNRVGHFEPVGTHRDFRRQGLARALLLHGLRELRRSGMETATIEHDASNLAAARLYASLGFEKRYETLGFKRPARQSPHGRRA